MAPEKIEPRILVGTSGFSYEDWRGRWYPPDLPRAGMLDAYASVFDALEINATYYHTPPPRAAESMVRRAAGRLRFAIKAPGRLTHERLLGPSVVTPFRRFLDPFAGAGVLGPVLFQFPNAMRWDAGARRFLDTVAREFRGCQAVLEFRHASWDSGEARAFASGLGCVIAGVDQPRLDGLAASVQPGGGQYGAPIAYYRFHGRNGGAWYARGDDDPAARYRYSYSAGELAALAGIVRERSARAATAYAFFNNHPDGEAPRNAEAFAALLGVPLRGEGYRDLFG